MKTIKCTACGQNRQVIELVGGFEFAEPCPCRREFWRQQEEQQQRQHLADMRKVLPERLRAATFAADDGKDPATAQLKRYADKFEELRADGQGLLLWGEVGTGKSWGAAAIINALIDKGFGPAFTSLPEILKMEQDFNNADYLVGSLYRKPLIVIDDLGTERGTAWANEKIYNFINTCNTRNIPLIITTNLHPTDLEKASKESSDHDYARIYSRILERCYPIKINTVKRRAGNQVDNFHKMSEMLRGENA